MTPELSSAATCCGEHCITCADEGVPMTVVSVDQERGLAVCADDSGARSEVETALVSPVAAGHRVLVHAGVAIVDLGRQEIAA